MATVTAPPEEGIRPRAVYTRIEALGLLLAALAPAFALAAALATGMSVGEELAFFGATIALPLVAAALVWRFGTWAKVVGILVALAAGVMLFWMAFGLAYPASLADFVPGVLLPLGVLVAVAGGVAAIVQQRRGHLAVGATAGERRIGAVVVAVALFAVVASGVLMLVGRSAAEGAGALSATIKNFEFSQEAYTIPAGEPTSIVVHNSDAFVHTFTVPALGIHEVVMPGNDVRVEVTAPAGTYTLYCEPHSDMSDPNPATAGMAALLVAE